MRYFGKSIVYNTIQVAGKNVPFIESEAGQGILATDDPAIIESLETRIRERRGGIWEMTQEQYDEALKKNSVLNSKQPSLLESVLRGGLSLAEVQRLASRSDAPAAPVAAEAPKPVVSAPVAAVTPATQTTPSPVEATVSRPSVGKVKR